MMKQGSVSRVTEIPAHHLGESTRERNLVLEHMPSVPGRFFFDFTCGSFSFRSSSISTVVIGRIVDQDTDYVYPMASILLSERSEGVVEQGETDRSEILGSDGNENVPRRMIRRSGKYRFRRSAVDDDEALVLKLVGNQAGQNPRIGFDRVDQMIRKIEPRWNDFQVSPPEGGIADDHTLDVESARRRRSADASARRRTWPDRSRPSSTVSSRRSPLRGTSVALAHRGAAPVEPISVGRAEAGLPPRAAVHAGGRACVRRQRRAWFAPSTPVASHGLSSLVVRIPGA